MAHVYIEENAIKYDVVYVIMGGGEKYVDEKFISLQANESLLKRRRMSVDKDALTETVAMEVELPTGEDAPTTSRISVDKDGPTKPVAMEVEPTDDDVPTASSSGFLAFKYREISQKSRLRLYQCSYVPERETLPDRYLEKENGSIKAEMGAIAKGKTALSSCAAGPLQGLLRCIKDAEKDPAVSVRQFVPKHTDEEYDPREHGTDTKCTVCGN